jgi:hypothetical protein
VSVLPAAGACTAHHFPSLIGHQRRAVSPGRGPGARQCSRPRAVAHSCPQPDDVESIWHGSLGSAQPPVLLKPDTNQKRYSAYLWYLE